MMKALLRLHKQQKKPELVCKEFPNNLQAPSYIPNCVATPSLPLANHNALNYGPFSFPINIYRPTPVPTIHLIYTCKCPSECTCWPYFILKGNLTYTYYLSELRNRRMFHCGQRNVCLSGRRSAQDPLRRPEQAPTPPPVTRFLSTIIPNIWPRCPFKPSLFSLSKCLEIVMTVMCVIIHCQSLIFQVTLKW